MREMAAKTAFLLASYQLRVSEDWVVEDAVDRKRSPRVKFPASRENVGNFANLGQIGSENL